MVTVTNTCKYVIYQTNKHISEARMIWLARGSDDVRRHRKSRRLATRSSSDWLVPRWPCWLIGWVAEARRIARHFSSTEIGSLSARCYLWCCIIHELRVRLNEDTTEFPSTQHVISRSLEHGILDCTIVSRCFTSEVLQKSYTIIKNDYYYKLMI